MTAKQGPVLIELEEAGAETPATAPPVPDGAPDMPTGQAMQTMAVLAARRRSRLGRFFWGALVALIGFVASVMAWDFITGLLSRNTVVGTVALGLVVLVLVACVLVALREVAAFARLRRVDSLHHAAEAALVADDLAAARVVTGRLEQLYHGREDLAWGRQRFDERKGEMLDTDGLLALAELELLAPLDAAAAREIEAAARQVAAVTALVPLALADLIAALTSNLRMIRRIAEIYGGRAGVLGSWRLTQVVMTHLVATGAVAVGDDMLGSFAGGGVLSKVSRRFGEGVVNGALTARVGVAAMEVCRPLPFVRKKRPSVTALVKRALTGLFGEGGA
ncbi:MULTISPECIES: YcjF family protein [Actibacterium]|uniref:Putative membrane protein n=1 Tax=Actibacterium naphthalenivorans TaxID=1614693 RepID=A0A840C593_9RHOB|nr:MULTISPECIES: TIGR01620 family protein [Actibacterium]ALG89690.1 GTP-binding protein [Actibacterium sp. EMB200-NS6]MBB4020625.1 putative membrane protein [Actibacterium naphthalenivorans]